LTMEKFIGNPFSADRLYKTGDLARWLPDGNIEFLGRIDHQVKIRGFRIELGEIESRLLEHDSVKEAVVLDRDDNGNKYLCAYIVAHNELTTAKIREHLSKQLPDYMIPQYFVQLDKIPLTSNGKADRKALPNPENTMGTGVEYVAAGNEPEQKLVSIWSEILGIEKQKLSIRDSFFTIGGDSIKSKDLQEL
jgi:acyl-coenzyme A synthetase/AMP-(fatty) acid ligase